MPKSEVSKKTKAGIKKQKIEKVEVKLSNVFRLFQKSLKNILAQKRIFIIILLIYLVLTLIFVGGLSSANVSQLKTNLNTFFHGSSKVSTGVGIFGTLLSGSTASTATNAGIYQTILLIVFSLIIIWTLRQSLSNKQIKISDVFYKSSYPLIPFLLIVLWIGLELIPLFVAGFLYSVVFSGGIAVSLFEKGLWLILCIGLISLSIYWLSSSIFALYIVTLPDMRPRQALKSARQLVKKRRWTIARRLVFLPIILLVIVAVITVPIIIIWAPIAAIILFLLSFISLPIIHSYMYTLYRELL